MPRLIRFYILHCLLGFSLAAAFTAFILWFNVANLGHLVKTSSIGVMASLVFWVLNGLVFAGVQFGVALMLLDGDEDDPPGGTGLPVAAPALAPVHASVHGPVRGPVRGPVHAPVSKRLR